MEWDRIENRLRVAEAFIMGVVAEVEVVGALRENG
jgi:hypothetical protein